MLEKHSSGPPGSPAAREATPDDHRACSGNAPSLGSCCERRPKISEDWLSFHTGMAVFLLSLGVFLGADLLGFGAKVATWTDLSKAVTPVSASFKWMPAWLAGASRYLLLD